MNSTTQRRARVPAGARLLLRSAVDSPVGRVDCAKDEGFRGLVKRGILVADPSNRSVAPPGAIRTGRAARRPTDSPMGEFSRGAPTRRSCRSSSRRRPRRLQAQVRRLREDRRGGDGARGRRRWRLDEDGLLFLGHRVLGTTRFRVYLQTRPIRKATEERLSFAAGVDHVVLVVPRGRLQKHALRQIAMPTLSGAWQPRSSVRLCAHSASNRRSTRPSMRRRMRASSSTRATMRLWVDGVLCEAVKETQFRLMGYMVDHATMLMPHESNRRLSRRRPVAHRYDAQRVQGAVRRDRRELRGGESDATGQSAGFLHDGASREVQAQGGRRLRSEGAVGRERLAAIRRQDGASARRAHYDDPWTPIGSATCDARRLVRSSCIGPPRATRASFQLEWKRVPSARA